MPTNTDQHVVRDLLNPDNEMFLSNGEKPAACVVGIHPKHDERIAGMLSGVAYLMQQYMLPDNLNIIIQEEIELISGRIMEIHQGAMLISCGYENNDSKVMYIDLHAPESIHLH